MKFVTLKLLQIASGSKIIVFGVLLLLTVSGRIFADEKSYNEAMASALSRMKTAVAAEEFMSLANQFENIAQADTTQWLPYYYSAYAYITCVFLSRENSNADLVLDKAQLNIDKAFKIQPDESEIYVVQGILYIGRIVADPTKRGAKFTQMAAEMFRKAQQQDSVNPRADYMLGVVLLNTPEYFGGGKQVAATHFKVAMQKFEKFEPTSKLHPVWGREDCRKQLVAGRF